MKLKLLLALLPLGIVSSLNAQVLLAEDFESTEDGFWPVLADDNSASPDVDAAGSDGNTSGLVDTSLWVRASEGFGSGRQGLVDESHGDFADPLGTQGYAFRYTNSGITTIGGLFGTLGDFVGTEITVSFDVVLDGHNSGQPFSVGLVTFATTDSADRNNITGGMGEGTSAILSQIDDAGDGTGSTGITVDTTYQAVSFSYTPDGTESALTDDLALRLDGATTTAIIDNVVVAVPEPGSFALIGGFLALTWVMIRRRS